MSRVRKMLFSLVPAVFVISLILFSLPLHSSRALAAPGRSGGPDSFGYTFLDSYTPEGPTYSWIEISSTGTEVLPSSDDSYTDLINMGFFFNYYGTDYTQIRVANNGLLFEVAPTSQYVNEPITQTPGVHGFIAPFWDDIVTWGSAGSIYYQTLGEEPNRKLVIEWKDNQHYYSSTSGITSEAVLFEGSNNILFQYQDVDFGTVSGSTSSDLPPYDHGGSATVGIEGPTGDVGLQYSFNEQVINPGLAILFKFPQFAGTNLFLSKQAPASKDHGSAMTYTLHYNNFGNAIAKNVVLKDSLPVQVEFVSASDGGIYDSSSDTVTWNIGDVPALGHAAITLEVGIPSGVPISTIIENNASITTSTLEVRYDDNEAEAQTRVTGSNLPADTGVGPTLGNTGGTPSVYWGTPITFSYHSSSTTIGVDIEIHIDDGGPDITGSMSGGPPDWTYTTTFYPRNGRATVTYTVSGQSCSIDTNWGLEHENDYNSIILEEISEVWSDTLPPLSPMIVKAIIATESRFNKNANNGHHCGLMQTPCDYDYSRFHVGTWDDPRTAIHVGLLFLRDKMNSMQNSAFLSGNILGLALDVPSQTPELWKYVIDAYNGGQGTMRNAMAYTKQAGQDENVWQSMVEPQSNPTQSPLYKAVILNGWDISKYNEIKNYIIGPWGVQHWLSLSGTSIEDLAVASPCIPQVSFGLYVDPAGYIYDSVTGERISSASVWLQRPDGLGGWESVPTGQNPPIMQPDANPLVTGADGQYQWDVLEGSYRVHVEASGYIAADSIVVSIPPPITDLHVGLTPLPYDLVINSTAGGAVTSPGTGTFTRDAGTVVDLAATPDAGYRFVNWTGDVSTVANVYCAVTNITMNGNYSITANFVRQHSLTITSSVGGTVTVPGVGTYACDAGTVVGIMATSDSGYGFVNWTGDVSTVGNVSASTSAITMNGDYDITASFEQVSLPRSGCFIATAAYGTPMANEVQALRDFRDQYLLTNPLGQAFVNLYYKLSPPIAEFITEHPSLKPIVRIDLLPAVAMSNVVVNTTLAEKVAVLGLLAMVSVAVAVWLTRRRDKGPANSHG